MRVLALLVAALGPSNGESGAPASCERDTGDGVCVPSSTLNSQKDDTWQGSEELRGAVLAAVERARRNDDGGGVGSRSEDNPLYYALCLSPSIGELCRSCGPHPDDSMGPVRVSWWLEFPTQVLGQRLNAAMREMIRRTGQELFISYLDAQTDIERQLLRAMMMTAGEMHVSMNSKTDQIDLFMLSSEKESLKTWGSPHPPYLLLLSEFIQSSGLDEHVYHGALVHSVLLAHPEPEHIFIGGSGEGLALRDVLQHRTVKSAVIVEINADLVWVARNNLAAINRNSFDDTRTELVIGDARAYLEEKAIGRLFDVIILDFNDIYFHAHSPPGTCLQLGGLFSREFFAAAKRRLKPRGVLIAQVPMQFECSVRAALAASFGVIRLAAVPMAAYPFNQFIIASDATDPAALNSSEIDARIAARIEAPMQEATWWTSAGSAAHGETSSSTWYTGAAHEQLFDLQRRYEEKGLWPCADDCTLTDLPEGPNVCRPYF